jgi:hypothetical protein
MELARDFQKKKADTVWHLLYQIKAKLINSNLAVESFSNRV